MHGQAPFSKRCGRRIEPHKSKVRGGGAFSVADARSDAVEEVRDLVEAVEIEPTPPPSPLKPRASAADRARAVTVPVVLNTLREAAAKAAADLARVTQELEKDRKRMPRKQQPKSLRPRMRQQGPP
jgi:hypothetical protein